jgi:predicted RNase H-like nuclease (RuvC/YqgF family)
MTKEELRKAHKALEEEHAKLQAAFDEKASSDATTQARLEVLEKELINKEEAIANLEATVASLSKAQGGKPRPKVVDLPVIKYDGKNYQVKMHAVILEGQKITPEDLLGDDLLIKKLLDQKSGMLAQV